MKLMTTALLSLSLLVCAPQVADASSLVAKVDVSDQTMRVYKNGKQLYRWRVSTARKGKYTPRGAWSAKMVVAGS